MTHGRLDAPQAALPPPAARPWALGRAGPPAARENRFRQNYRKRIQAPALAQHRPRPRPRLRPPPRRAAHPTVRSANDGAELATARTGSPTFVCGWWRERRGTIFDVLKRTARQLAELAELVRSEKLQDFISIEHQKSGKTHLLTKIRFGTSASGRTTKRIMECLEDGRERAFDKDYDFDVPALITRRRRADL